MITNLVFMVLVTSMHPIIGSGRLLTGIHSSTLRMSAHGI